MKLSYSHDHAPDSNRKYPSNGQLSGDCSDDLSGLQAKMQKYIDNGTLLGLLIDRKNQTVHIYRPNQAPEILDDPEAVSCDPELPGFTLRMAKIW